MEIKDFPNLLKLPYFLITTLDYLDGIDIFPTKSLMAVSVSPPLLAFSASKKENCYANILDKKEFVVNLVTKAYETKIKKCFQKFPKGLDEFEQVGFTKKESKKVKVPSIKEAIAWIECKWVGAVKIDHLIEQDSIPIFGKVVWVEVVEDWKEKLKEEGLLVE